MQTTVPWCWSGAPERHCGCTVAPVRPALGKICLTLKYTDGFIVLYVSSTSLEINRSKTKQLATRCTKHMCTVWVSPCTLHFMHSPVFPSFEPTVLETSELHNVCLSLKWWVVGHQRFYNTSLSVTVALLKLPLHTIVFCSNSVAPRKKW